MVQTVRNILPDLPHARSTLITHVLYMYSMDLKLLYITHQMVTRMLEKAFATGSFTLVLVTFELV